jgi:hypothetical protein
MKLSDMDQKSSTEMAREYEARLENYLSQVDALPSRRGKVNVSAIAAACGFDRQVLYKNKVARQMLEEASRQKGLTGIVSSDSPELGHVASEDWVPAARLREEQQRVAALEKRLSEMIARNAALNARIRQNTMIENQLISSGRRPRPNGAGSLFKEQKS